MGCLVSIEAKHLKLVFEEAQLGSGGIGGDEMDDLDDFTRANDTVDSCVQKESGPVAEKVDKDVVVTLGKRD